MFHSGPGLVDAHKRYNETPVRYDVVLKGLGVGVRDHWQQLNK
jgi:hypothetical protein